MYQLKFPLPVIIRIPSVTNDLYDSQAISDVRNGLGDEQMDVGHVANWNR
jgi:hypothetical protein